MTSTPTSAELLALMRADLGAFTSGFWPSFEMAPHTKLLIDALEAVERGEVKRLLISLPPRSGKSELLATNFVPWVLGRDPRREVAYCTYANEFSEDWGRKARNRMSDPLFRSVFPKCKVSDDSAGASRFHTTSGGAAYFVGKGGQLTGRGCNYLLIDDIIKDAAEANSPAILRAMRDWYNTTAYTRLSPGGAVVVVGTRWSESDLIGFLSAEHGAEGWRTINLPALSEGPGDQLNRPEGAALWPARFSVETLEAIRRQLGSAAFASLYQGRPAALEGGIFKRAWWQFYREQPTQFDQVIQSWDTAFKTGTSNDYSVGFTIGVTKTGYYLPHRFRDRLEFPQLKRTMISLAEQWKPHQILVEDKASGQSALQSLRQETRLPILAIKVDADKLTRASAASPLVEAGRVFLPEPSLAPWVDEFLDEISVFPNGAHDDQVDALVQALNHLRGNYSTSIAFFSLLHQRQHERGEYPSNTIDSATGLVVEDCGDRDCEFRLRRPEPEPEPEAVSVQPAGDTTPWHRE